MKKIIGIVCLILSLVLLAACAESDAKADVSLEKIYQEIKAEVTLPDMVELDNAEKLDRNYGISADMIGDFAGGIDSSGVTMEEIVLIRAKDRDSAADIKEKLSKRLSSKLDQNRNYNPEEAAVIEKCQVETEDLYVFLIISDEADKIREIVNKHLK